MDHQHPFVLYLNISVCLILLFLALPSLLNRREELRTRLAFFSIFFVVIATCVTNLCVMYTGNYKLVFLGYYIFFFSLAFGPLIYYYVKSLLGAKISRSIYFSLVPGVASVIYGTYLAVSSDEVKENAYQQIISGQFWFFEITNLLTLVLTLIYCIKAWFFLKRFKQARFKTLDSVSKLKFAWAREFIQYTFANVFIFLLLVLVLTNFFGVSTMYMDLVGMPVFMLIVYLLIAIRSMMMYKEFEHQVVLTRIEGEKQIQEQRFDIARDLHDSLGAHLTFIASVSDGLKMNSENLDEHTKAKLSSLSDFTENSITELKNALWILNSNEITLEDLKNKILNFTRAAGEAKGEMQFYFQFEIKENRPIDSKWAVNVFRMVQELVNNAIKYAHATEVWIEMEQSGKMLSLKVRDNGIGFDTNSVPANSFGVANIRKRVQGMDGKLQIDAAVGRGVSCLIELKLQ